MDGDGVEYLFWLLKENETENDKPSLRIIYPNLMKLDYDNARTRTANTITLAENVERRSPLDLFGEFYELQNNQPMSPAQAELMEQLIESIWEGDA